MEKQNIIEALCVPSAVTVYADRALVTRRIKLSLPQGKSFVRFTELPGCVDRSSIQVRGLGGFTLHDVRVEEQQLSQEFSPQIRAILDRKSACMDRLTLAQDALRLADAERQFLSDMAKGISAGRREQTVPDAAAWGSLADFYRERNATLDASTREEKKREEQAKAELDALERELSGMNMDNSKTMLQALLVLEAQAAGDVEIELSYLVYGPSWRPDYVLRAEPANGRVQLLYRAYVMQNSGEAWNDVELSLSTASPSAGGQAPELSPWYVDVMAPPPPLPMAKSMVYAGSRSSDMVEMAMSPEEPMYLAEAMVSEQTTSALFSVADPVSIGDDNQERNVTIMVRSMNAVFSWEAAPKLSPFVYYRAQIQNDSGVPLLPGTSHIYVDGSFVADGNLPEVQPGGLFHAGLGADPGVSAKRVFIKSRDESAGLGAKRSRTTWEYKLELKNSTRHDVALRMTDQLPVPLNEQITVKLLSPAYSKDTDSLKKLQSDILEWNLLLAPGESKSIGLSYSVEYPKGIRISGL
ncbi:MAG TPA: mucoidy inhibitor MuiA family protein [Spirochaetales bacterium]|nr:mucoidy inhibitor MuiA family protein [Spirochaetales bacterium]